MFGSQYYTAELRKTLVIAFAASPVLCAVHFRRVTVQENAFKSTASFWHCAKFAKVV